jgi:hypothetical protein
MTAPSAKNPLRYDVNGCPKGKTRNKSNRCFAGRLQVFLRLVRSYAKIKHLAHGILRETAQRHNVRGLLFRCELVANQTDTFAVSSQSSVLVSCGTQFVGYRYLTHRVPCTRYF